MSKYKYSGGFSMGDFITKYLLEDNSEFAIERVIYNDPVTVVIWDDDTKTVSKCANGDVYSKEAGLAICVLKKFVGSTNVRELLNDWTTQNHVVTISEVRKKHKNS